MAGLTDNVRLGSVVFRTKARTPVPHPSGLLSYSVWFDTPSGLLEFQSFNGMHDCVAQCLTDPIVQDVHSVIFTVHVPLPPRLVDSTDPGLVLFYSRTGYPLPPEHYLANELAAIADLPSFKKDLLLSQLAVPRNPIQREFAEKVAMAGLHHW